MRLVQRLAVFALSSSLFAACSGGSSDDPSNTGDGGSDAAADAGTDASPRDLGMPDLAMPVDAAAPVDAAPDAPSCTPTTCEAAGAMCGTIEDGCGLVLDCGGCEATEECGSGRCACLPDSAEPNAADTAAKYLGDLTDSPDSSADYENYMIASMADVDWFRVNVADGWDTGNPEITVSLTDIPPGQDYDLLAWFRCDEGGDESACTSGSPEPGSSYAGRCISESRGSVGEQVRIATECSGTTDETGKLYIRVRPHTYLRMCLPYSLRVEVQ